MLAIFKKEFSSYFRSARGYVFLALNVLLSGAFITFCNFTYMSARIERALEVMIFALLFTIPVITIKSFASERESGTERLLVTLPLRSRDVVLGKLLAALALVGIDVALVIVFPPILSIFGKVNFAASYAAIFGYAIFAVAFTAICVFISCSSKKILTSGLISYGVAIALFALWLVVLNFSAKLPKLLAKILEKISFVDAFDSFALGILSIFSIVFYLSIAAFFIFLTLRCYNNKRAEHKASPVIAIVLAISLVALNVLCALVPNKFNLDLSTNKSFSISDSTVKFLSELDEDVTVYVIDADGTSTQTEYQLSLFDEYSDHLSVEYVALSDVEEELKAFGYTEGSVVTPYSIYVKSEYRSAFADGKNMFVYYHPSFGEMSYSTYNSYLAMLYQYSMSDQSYGEMLASLVNDSIVYYQLDAMLASYVEYASVEIIPTLYYATSHGTLDMSSILGLTLNDMGTKTVDLASVTELPADIGALIINAPAEDFSESETAMLRAYLENGGSAVFLTDTENLSMPNLMSLLTAYGVSAETGLVAIDEEVEVDVVEEDQVGSEFEKVTSYNINTSINPDHDALYAIASESVPVVNANHITIPESTDGSLIVTPLLTTSADAYIDGVEGSAGAKTIGVAIEKETESGTTEIAWFTGADSFLDDNISITNFYTVMYSASWGIESFESQVSNIPPTLMAEDMITAPASLPKIVISLSLIISVAIGGVGIAVCHKRKSRKPVIEEAIEE